MIINNEKTIRFGQFFESKCNRRYVREHDTIKNAIANHFMSLCFQVVTEGKDIDEDSSYRYDVIAQNKKELHVIEIKPIIDKRDFGQIHAYINQINKENPNAKVWLATDCLQFDSLIRGEIGEMVKEWMKENNMGIILCNPELIWLIPTFNDLLNIQERGHLCETCNYCKGFTMNGACRKLLVYVEEGLKKPLKIINTDYDEVYEFEKDIVKQVKKEFLQIKKQIGKKTFEEQTGIRIE